MSTDTSHELPAIHGGRPARTAPLPWELPGSHWMGQEEIDGATKVLTSRSPFRYYGPKLEHMVDRLEEAFAARLGRKYALGTASGTAALSCAFAALRIGPGDEVLIPGYLWVSCVGAIVRAGAIPRLVDIDDTFCVSPEDMANKIGPRTKALLLIHMSGAPGNLDAIMAIARESGIKVVEDCAQANGASYKGRPVGTFGDIAIFSFQLNKNMTAGEGGILVCDDEKLYKRSFAAHDMGYARNAEGRLDWTDDRYQLWGLGARMSELAGAVALAQLQKLDKITAAMHKSKYAIREELASIAALQPRRIVDPDGDTAPFFIVTLPTPETCQQFYAALEAEGIRGPEGSMACIPMERWGLHWHWNNRSLVEKRSQDSSGRPWTDPLNDFARDYCYERGVLPNCSDLASRSVLLTIASCLTDQDVEEIILAYRKAAAATL